MKIGIVGSGKIVDELLGILPYFKKNVVEIVGICTRAQSLNRVMDMAKKYNIKNIYDDYKNMLDNPNIDTIYVALPNSLHYEYAKKSLQNGKNTICEKPFTNNVEELRELISLAKKEHLYLFEAITTIHSPNFQHIKNLLKQIEPIHYCQLNFSQYSSRYDKYLEGDITPVFDPNLDGGALRDLNIYNLHFLVGLFGTPKDIIYRGNCGHNGIDTSGTLLLSYEKMTAIANAAKDCMGHSEIVIEGENGYIQINSAANDLQNIEINTKNSIAPILSNKDESRHRMILEFENFSNIIDSKKYSKMEGLLEHSIKVMETMDKAIHS